MITAEAEPLSQDEMLFVNDPLAYLGLDPVTFPVSDGSTVTVSAFADHVLRETFGINRVKAVHANGARYLYTPCEVPDLDVLANYQGRAGRPRRWLFAELLARHVYRLHVHLPGEGRIAHNGSHSFLPGDFSREALERLPEEPAKKETARIELPTPFVSEEVIRQQLDWLTENQTGECAASELMRKARKTAAKRLSNPVASDVVQEVFAELFVTVKSGQCACVTRKDFFNYVIGAVRNRCCDIATEGCCNQDILPDKLETKMKKRGIVRGEMPEDRQEQD